MKKPIALRKPSVLAVDDYEANLVALEAVLGSDYKLLSVHSGTEAIDFLNERANEIDVILMDIQMPGLDGFETAAAVKQIPGAADIPIIFITAVYKEEPFFKRGYEVGGVDYFSKPFDPEILKLKLGIYASVRQRTEILRQREKQIEETEELLRVGRKLSAVLESLPVGVLISDVDGRICQINDHVSQICNKFPADPNSYGEMLGWWDKQGRMIADSGPLSHALRKGENSRHETIAIECANGKSKTVLCSASPLLGLSGHIVGAVVVLQDVTESKKIEADLENRITKVVSLGLQLEESITH